MERCSWLNEVRLPHSSLCSPGVELSWIGCLKVMGQDVQRLTDSSSCSHRFLYVKPHVALLYRDIGQRCCLGHPLWWALHGRGAAEVLV